MGQPIPRPILTEAARVLLAMEKRKALEQEVKEAEILFDLVKRHLDRARELEAELRQLDVGRRDDG